MTSASESPAHAMATSSAAAPPLTRAFLSGAVAGVVADSMLHPLETINMRIKVQTRPSLEYSNLLRSAMTIVRNEGVRGCYSGLSTTMISAPICVSMYFGAYETIKKVALPHVSEKQAGAVYFLAGACSEAIVSAISVPAEVVKMQLQLGRNPNRASSGAIARTSNYRGTWHALLSIVQKRGIRGLYAGYTACLSVDTVFSAFSFLFYETLKRSFHDYRASTGEKERPLTTVESLVMGSVSGGAAAFLTNPLDMMTVRLMTQGSSKRYAGLADCFLKTVTREGPFALWRGAQVRVTAVMPNMGICFGVYETIKWWLFKGELDAFDWDDR